MIAAVDLDEQALLFVLLLLALMGAIITVLLGAGSKEAENIVTRRDEVLHEVYAAASKASAESEFAFRRDGAIRRLRQAGASRSLGSS
jgi:hypothetical protein